MFNKTDTVLITDTSFGRIVLERKQMKDMFESSLLGMQTKLIGEIFTCRNNLKAVVSQISSQSNISISSIPDNNIIMEMFTGMGWFINGNYIHVNAYEDVHTIDELIDYIFNDRYNLKATLSVFHRLVLVEIISQFYPEVILKKQDAFEYLKNA